MIAKNPTLLRSLLVAKGLLRQKQIATQFHVSENTITRWLRGEVMTSGAAKRIAEFLEHDTNELFISKEPEKTPSAVTDEALAEFNNSARRKSNGLQEILDESDEEPTKRPNATLQAAMDELERGEGERVDNVDDLFKALEEPDGG